MSRAACSRPGASDPTYTLDSEEPKKDLIEDFVDQVSGDGRVDDEWQRYVAAKQAAELAEIVSAENLRPEATQEFVDAAFRDGVMRTTGTAIISVLPPVSRFAKSGGYGERKQRVIDKLTGFFERFFR